jgi:hypothetical protein
MVLQVYIDDSGRGNRPVYVLGGWLADSTAWASFSDDWALALSEPPAMTYFKMAKAVRWRSEVYKRKISRLATIIKKHVTLGVSLLVLYEYYDRIIKGKLETQFDDLYCFAFYKAMIGMTQVLAETRIAEPIDFIFDEQYRQSAFVMRAYDMFLERVPNEYKPLIGSPPRFKDDEKCPPLQAADMYAWHIRRAQADFETGGTFSSPAWAIFDSMEHQQIWTTEEELERIVRC